MGSLLSKIATLLRNSPRVHLRQEEISSSAELVRLLDRFLDDKMSYPLEWDDFISWPNANPEIEAWRHSISDLEPLYVGGEQESSQAQIALQQIRDDVAASAGISPRFS